MLVTSFVIECFARLSWRLSGPIITGSDIPGKYWDAQLLPSAQRRYHPSSSQYKQSLRFRLMSHSQVTSASSSNFQLIINNALEAYKRHTKNDLLAHPLASQLQACDSPGAILAVLQQQVQGLDQSRTDDRWTKWLDPIVNVLFAFSSTLGAGVGLVCSRKSAYVRSAL